MLLLAADFYYSKNIAGRRLVGLRWWNEVDTSTGDSHWVFESQDRSAEGGPGQNATDKRYVLDVLAKELEEIRKWMGSIRARGKRRLRKRKIWRWT